MEKIVVNDFIAKFKDALNADNKEIFLDDKFRDYDEWDSMRYLSVISMLDSEYDVIIEPKEFQKIETVRELIKEVEKRQNK
ncbi:MAG: acyl carrier protein [Bacteroidales bacterium]|nr:acyl carrier protein [Bacteroidales bacterium]